MKLYHFTDNKIQGKVQVKYFGANDYTARDARTCNIKRAFYFTSPEPPEYRFKHSKYKYIVNISDGAIYNLVKDGQGVIKKYGDINSILSHIKRAGFKGVLYNIGYDVVCLFYDTKI
jgi:hypothetical protein